MYRIEIDHLPPTLNQFYSGVHWTARKRWKDAWDKFFLAEFRKNKLPRSLKTPIIVASVQYCKSKVRDGDNSVIGPKFFQDVLVKYGYIPDDSYKNVSSVVLQTRKGKKDKIAVYIFESAWKR